MLTHKILAATAALILLSGLASPAMAQTTAIQGPADPDSLDEGKQFRSPMILEIALAPFDNLLQQKWVTIDDMPGYRCEGVSLQRVRVRAKRQRSGALDLFVKTDTYTIRGRDKWADLLFELILDGKIAASDLIRNVDAEEKTTRHVSGYLEVPGGTLEGEEKPVLKITVTVTEG